MAALPGDDAVRLLAAIGPHLPDTMLAGAVLAAEALEPLPDYGAGHRHICLGGSGLMARIPRRLPDGADPATHLAYEAACFDRAYPSGATPRCHGVVPPSPGLPLGALLVQRIDGAIPVLPRDLPAIAGALAAIHRLDLPPPSARPPLPERTDPVSATIALIGRQAGALDAADLDRDSAAQIRAECAAAARLTPVQGRHPGQGQMPGERRLPPIVLAGVDTHPGNFLIDRTGHAWFVDLERVAYDAGAIDINHVTLPTSTGWDMRIATAVTAEDARGFERAYCAALPSDLAAATRPWLCRLRRLTWLRSLTWFVQWRARRRSAEAQPGDPAPDPDISAHMAAHVDEMLSASHIHEMRDCLPPFA